MPDTPLGDIAVWWLAPRELQQLVADGPGTVDIWRILDLPAYIGRELDSATGRNGRGRLWTPPEIGIDRIAWDECKLAAPHCALRAGIVVWRHDAPLLARLPGFVTDAWLEWLCGGGNGD